MIKLYYFILILYKKYQDVCLSVHFETLVPIFLFYTRDKFVYHIIGGVQYTSINYPLSYPSRSLVNRICKVQDEFHKSKAYGVNGYFQGSKGDKTIDDKFMYIYDIQNYTFCTLP